MPDLPDTSKCTPLSFDFNNHPFTVLEINGVPYFIAKEVGDVLGYAEEGTRLVAMINRDWVDELTNGRAPIKLEGDALDRVKELLAARIVQHQLTTEPVGSRARHLLLLTEPGLYRVLMLAGGPVACRFRDWLDSDVLPSLRRTGSYTLPSATSPAALAGAFLRSVPPELREVPADVLVELLTAEEAVGRPLVALRTALLPRARRGRRQIAAASATDTARAALVDVVAWASSQQGRFFGRHRGVTPPAWLGRWDGGAQWTELAILSGELRTHLAAQGLVPNPILKTWSEQGWLVEGDRGHRTLHRQIDTDKARCFVFMRAALERVVGEVAS